VGTSSEKVLDLDDSLGDLPSENLRRLRLVLRTGRVLPYRGQEVGVAAEAGADDREIARSHREQVPQGVSHPAACT
jgi:hypothetical protein